MTRDEIRQFNGNMITDLCRLGEALVKDSAQAPSATTPALDGRSSRAGNVDSGFNPDVVFRIARAAHISFELDAKTDAQIAEMLLKSVWADLHTGTLEAELVDQAITRLRKERP